MGGFAKMPQMLAAYGNAHDTRFLAIGVVKKHQITFFHLIPHHVTCLVIANAVPHFAAVALQVIDAVGIGLGFHQPVIHSLRYLHGFRGGEV